MSHTWNSSVRISFSDDVVPAPHLLPHCYIYASGRGYVGLRMLRGSEYIRSITCPLEVNVTYVSASTAAALETIGCLVSRSL